LLADGDTTPVIFITAHSEPEVRMQALSLGCAGFFLKSDPGAAIIEVLRRVTLKGSAQS
jgi:DNA-binding NarL/FixJ family response regulator